MFKNTKGFTLIEFIIVMAIIGILVLLASPKFLDYVDKAKLTQIKNDIKVVENITISYLADNDFNINTLKETDKKEGLSLISNSLNDTIVLEGKTFDITKFIDSKLKGNFVMNQNYTVIYIDDQIINKEPENSYDEFLATDEDFEFIQHSSGYDTAKDGKGYYRYIGNKDIVKIPKEINGTNIINTYKMFEESNLTNLKVIDNGQLTNTSYMFNKSSNLKNLDLSNLNTQSVTTMNSMFQHCENLTKLNLSNFNTEDVVDMAYMFNNCSSLKELDLSSFNTEKVKDMQWMFRSCNMLENLDLYNFDTKNVTNMESMFHYCNSLIILKLSSFDTSNVTNMWGMFSSCDNLTELDLSSFNTENVSDMSHMFYYCKSLKELDLSNFNTENVSDMSYMFRDCSSLNELNLSSFNTSRVTNMWYMFRNCSSLNELDLSSFNTENVSDMDSIFEFCNNLKTVYAKTKKDVDRFNNSSNKPKDLIAAVK